MKTLIRAFLFFGLMAFLQPAQAVLPDGSDAKDFTVTDLNGGTWHLFDLLDQGYTVYLEFSATWCGPCWNYHSGGHMEGLWNSYGPNGTDQVIVIFIEADLNTNTNCLYGPVGCNNSTQGDWVTGTPFPITDLTAANASIASNYQITYYPTIYSICPQTKKVYEAGQRNTGGLYEFVTSCAMTYDVNSVTDASCHGFEDGSIDIAPQGGYAPFSYEWSNGKFTQDINDLAAGTYTCTIKDKNNVEIETIDIVVGEPDAIDVVANQITIESCPGYGDGAIDISADGGAGGFGYLWSNGSSQEDISSLNAGSYSVIVTDSDGCTGEEIFEVDGNPAPVADAGDDGFLSCLETLATLDGTNSEDQGVTFQWSTPNGHIVSGATTPVCNVDEPGDYFLLVTFAATGCFSEDETLVQQDIEAPHVDAGANGVLNCATATDTLDGSDSDHGNGYSFLWTTQDGNILSGASTPYPVVDQPGTYTLTVTKEVTGCTATDEADVIYDNGPSAPDAAYNVTADDQEVTFTDQSAGNPQTWFWTFGDGQTSSAPSPVHTYQDAGEYEVCLVVTNACGTDTSCTTIEVMAAVLSVSTHVSNATCNHNSSDGSVDLTVTGGVPPYTFLWSNGATTEDLNDVPAGDYSVVITDSDGNEETVNVTVTAQYIVNIDEAIETEPKCFGESNGAIALNASSNGGPLTFAWSHDPELEGSVASNLPAGMYTVIASDGNGCSHEITIDLHQPAVLAGEVAVQNADPGQDNGSATMTPQGGTAPYVIDWSNGASGETVNNLAPGDYTVSVTDANGCLTTQNFTVGIVSSVQEFTTLTYFNLFPNPASEQMQLQMDFSVSEELQVNLVNLLGETVLTRQLSGSVIRMILPVGTLAPGTYFLQVSSDDGQLVHRLVVE